MYPPPPPPPLPPARQRHGVPALGVILIGLGCMLAGCIGGAAIASSPDPGTTTAASSSADPSPSTSATSARTASTTRTPDGRRKARPTPKRTTAKPRPKPRTTTRAPSTDPRYSTCTEARRHGLGPYRRGQTEYDWYEDRDGDGVVCES